MLSCGLQSQSGLRGRVEVTFLSLRSVYPVMDSYRFSLAASKVSPSLLFL